MIELDETFSSPLNYLRRRYRKGDDWQIKVHQSSEDRLTLVVERTGLFRIAKCLVQVVTRRERIHSCLDELDQLKTELGGPCVNFRSNVLMIPMGMDLHDVPEGVEIVEYE
jgi:hypothetical protein